MSQEKSHDLIIRMEHLGRPLGLAFITWYTCQYPQAEIFLYDPEREETVKLVDRAGLEIFLRENQ